MTNGSSPEDRRLSKFSKADRGPYSPPAQNVPVSETVPEEQPAPPDLALSDMIEHAIRDSGIVDSVTSPEEQESAPRRSYSNIDLRTLHTQVRQPESDSLPQKLIEELQIAQEQARPQPEEPAPPALMEPPHTQFEQPSARAEPVSLPALAPKPSGPKFSSLARDSAKVAASRLASGASWTGRHTGRGAAAAARGTARFARANKWSDWHRRYFNSVTYIHRRLFDGWVERLLFIKTVYPHNPPMPGEGLAKPRSFLYQGPLPRFALEWAFSALPPDLKRFAFVDFRAGHGRPLLLAARHNFEYAAGYAFDQPSCEQLEMNLSQYPRSYMSCRDVRAIRGDLEGVVIPPQPVVLFFPASIREAHLSIILSHVSASYRLNRRPMFLILEHVERGYKIEYDDIFKLVKPPLLSRAKTALLSPARTAVYYSPETAAQT